ncbi:MAG: type II toxin-antitoxin system PemK/MazF family toxin [Bacteroidetes bacterium]|nr:type II toxin-antitoxin system PemK/MazF family toxin [Bacteroidota bacterium]
MAKLNFGDIVLLKFPFSDGQTFKKRPALVLNDFNDGDILVCRITSQTYDTKLDVCIEDWEKSGLRLPSVARVHKIASLEKGMVEVVMGKISEPVKNEIKAIISILTD